MLIRSFFFLILLADPFSSFGQDCDNCGPSYNAAPVVSMPTWPLELINIATPNYPTNSRASFCRRPAEMVDTIVIHHTATGSNATPQDINRSHLNEGTMADPWYMVAYSYLVNAAYPGASTPAIAVSEGRPMEIVGAHAGSNIFVPMSADQQRLWRSGQITCGTEGGEFTENSSLVQGGRIKANVTTIGVAVIGNYAPRSLSNPLGYGRSRPRLPSARTLDGLARLSCQLQKKHPNIKSIKWHSEYHSTECPGTIKSFVGQIKTLARGYGCTFD